MVVKADFVVKSRFCQNNKTVVLRTTYQKFHFTSTLHNPPTPPPQTVIKENYSLEDLIT